MLLPEALRGLLSDSEPEAAFSCASQNVTYSHRVDDPTQWNWCVLGCWSEARASNARSDEWR